MALSEQEHDALQARVDAENQRDRRIEAVAESKRMARFLVGGNAGGTALLLTMIGAHIAKDPAGAFPGEMFWLLVVFLVGLLGAWVGMSGDAISTLIERYGRIRILRVDMSWRAKTAVERLVIGGYSLAGIGLLVGATASLIYLYGLTK